MAFDKVEAVLIRAVEAAFAAGAVEPRDHWEADRMAIGFVRSGDESRLVYVRVRSSDFEVIHERGDQNVERSPMDLEGVLHEVSEHLGAPRR
jgi:hypothetical protein